MELLSAFNSMRVPLFVGRTDCVMDIIGTFVRIWQEFPFKGLLLVSASMFVVFRVAFAKTQARGVKSPLLMKSLYFLMGAAPVTYALAHFNKMYCLGGLLPIGVAMVYLYRSYRAGEYPVKAMPPS